MAFWRMHRCNFRPKVAYDFISAMTVWDVAIDICEKYGCSRPNSLRDIAHSLCSVERRRRKWISGSVGIGVGVSLKNSQVLMKVCKTDCWQQQPIFWCIQGSAGDGYFCGGFFIYSFYYDFLLYAHTSHEEAKSSHTYWLQIRARVAKQVLIVCVLSVEFIPTHF